MARVCGFPVSSSSAAVAFSDVWGRFMGWFGGGGSVVFVALARVGNMCSFCLDRRVIGVVFGFLFGEGAWKVRIHYTPPFFCSYHVPFRHFDRLRLVPKVKMHRFGCLFVHFNVDLCTFLHSFDQCRRFFLGYFG